MDQRRGVVGVVNVAAEGGPGQPLRDQCVADRGVRIKGQRPAPIPEEPTAQRLGLAGFRTVIGLRALQDLSGQPRGVGALDSVELPGHPRRPLDQVVLHRPSRLEIVFPVSDPLREGALILAGQDGCLRRHSMLEGVEFRPALPLGGLGAGTFPAIAAAGLGLLLGRHGNAGLSGFEDASSRSEGARSDLRRRGSRIVRYSLLSMGRREAESALFFGFFLRYSGFSNP